MSVKSADRIHPVWTGIAILFAAAALALGIDNPSGITGLDEYWHSMRTALQSLEADAWLVPILDGEPRVEKPPLFYWLMMSSLKLFGVDFWSARLPALVSGIVLAAFVALLFRLLFRSDTTAAFLVTVGAFTVAVESRRAMLDLPVAACVAGAVLFAFLAMRERRNFGFIALAAVFAASGFMIKGPVALWFIAAAGLSALVFPIVPSSNPARWPWLLGALLLVLLISAWPLVVSQTVPDLTARLIADSADREIGELGLKNLTSVLGALVATAMPWLVAAATAHESSSQPAERQRVRWLFTWILIAILPFLFFRTFERYLLPLVVPIALLTAYSLRDGAKRRVVKLLSSVVLAALVILPIAVLGYWFGETESAGEMPLSSSVAVSVTIGALAIAIVGSWQRAVPLTCVGLIVATSLTLGVLYPALRVNRLPANVIELGKRGAIAHFHSAYPGTLSMASGRSVPLIKDSDSEALYAWASSGGMLVLREEDSARLQALCRSKEIIPVVITEFPMLYARGSFLRFTRPGVTLADWRQAGRSRSLVRLKPRFIVVRLLSPETKRD